MTVSELIGELNRYEGHLRVAIEPQTVYALTDDDADEDINLEIERVIYDADIETVLITPE
jgi:hypothetical protein